MILSLLGRRMPKPVHEASRLRLQLSVSALVIVTVVLAAGQASGGSAAKPPWGEVLNGLRMRVTTPAAGPDGVVVYRRGKTVPLEIEIENVGKAAIPVNKLSPLRSFKVVDLEGERIGVQGYLPARMISWRKTSDALLPGEKQRDVVYLERMRWRLPDGTGKRIRILMQLPTQKPVPNQLPVNAYANPITVDLQDSPFENSLKSADLPTEWQDNMEIEYVENGLFFGYMGVRIDGRGRVTTLGHRLRQGELIREGRFEYVLDAFELHEFMHRLKRFKIERLNPYHGKRYATDLVQVHLCIAAGAHTLVGDYEVFGDQTPDVAEFRKLMRGVLANMKPVVQQDTGDAAP